MNLPVVPAMGLVVSFDITVAEFGAVVELDGVLEYFWWESVSFVDIHLLILPIMAR